jgi:hypothetical protein
MKETGSFSIKNEKNAQILPKNPEKLNSVSDESVELYLCIMKSEFQE